MIPLRRVAFIGNHLPRRCGIATFTHDLRRAVSIDRPDLDTSVVAMTDTGRAYAYPPAVRFQVLDEKIDAYRHAAEFLNHGHVDIACLQHEYGIFGGEAGRHIIELVTRLKMPLITTLHTVLAEPTGAQRGVMSQIIDASAKIIVMAEKGRDLLCSVHGVPARKIEIIRHGIPEYPFLEPDHAKAKLGFIGKQVILTFGLLSPSKGIETVIDAMPAVIQSSPDAVYVILGATHPNLVRHEGEAYRDGLIARAKELDVDDHVLFFNQFVDQTTLLDFISMCDVYVTPYLNEMQMTSGTLAYSFGMGKAVVSTPFWHAQELLANGRGILVPFGDAMTLGQEISDLLTNDERRNAIRKRAFASSRSMTWAQTAKLYLAVFDSAHEQAIPELRPPLDPADSSGELAVMPGTRIGHFLSLCDDTGILQHAVRSVADRAHGYCVDDNARALLLSSTLAKSGDSQLLPEMCATRFAAFIQHAWNPDTRRFRNFMSYDRRWLEESGSEDSHGRTLWALAECARSDIDASRRVWAVQLFKTALSAVETFSSPRAWAFSLLGLDAFCELEVEDCYASRIRRLLADKLMALFLESQQTDWLWFESVLAYDNARISQALIQTGMAIRTQPYIEVGLQSLRWLVSAQTAPSGCFRPVGSKSFGRVRRRPEAFDQQPLEASATISACLAAWRASADEAWALNARSAFNWFLGKNDLHTALIDPNTGSCCDGLHPDRPNENKGAESVLAYLLSLTEMRRFETTATAIRTNPTSNSTSNGTVTKPSRSPPRSIIVPIKILEPPESLSTAGSSTGRRSAL